MRTSIQNWFHNFGGSPKKIWGGQSLEISILKLALLRGHGSHSLQIFTSGNGSWCLTYVPLGGPPPKKIWGQNFFPPLGSGGVVQTFPGNSPWKDVSKTGFKILGASPPQKKNLWGSKLAQISWFSDFFAHFSKTVQDIANLKSWFLIYGDSSTRWWRNGVLLSSKNYVIRAQRHPPSDLFKLALLGGQGSHSIQIFRMVVGHDV